MGVNTTTTTEPEVEPEPEDETIPKGGIAYYVRIDEGLAPPPQSAPFQYDYNPKGIMNKTELLFSDGTVATSSDTKLSEAQRSKSRSTSNLLSNGGAAAGARAKKPMTSSMHDLRHGHEPYLAQFMTQETEA